MKQLTRKGLALAFAFALCMAFGVGAMAENITITNSTTDGKGTTEVSYVVGPYTNYTVTIPSKVELTATTGSAQATGSLTVSLTAQSNVSNAQITVTMESTNVFKLKQDSTEIAYTVTKNNTEIKQKDGVLKWEKSATTPETSVTLTASATINDTLPAGTYTDTLTFTVTPSTTGTATTDPGWNGDSTVGF